MLGIAGSLYTAIILLVELPRVGVDADWQPWELQPGLLVTLPSVALSLSGHTAAPKLYQELKGRSPSRWFVVCLSSFSLCFVICIVCGPSGYMMFGSDLALPERSNILTAHVFQDLPEVMVAYVGSALSVTLSIPIYIMILRDSVESFCRQITARCASNPESSRQINPQEGISRQITPQIPPTSESFAIGIHRSTARHMLLSGGSVLLTLAIALWVDNLGVVNAMSGSICCTLITYILPALMYLRCRSVRDERFTKNWWLHRALPVFNIVVGIVIGIAGVTTTLMIIFGMSSQLRWQ